MNPIAVTGMGVLAPNGHSVGEFWDNCLAGVSGIARLEYTDCTGLEIDFGGEIKGFDFSPYVSRRDQRNYDFTQLLATAAACAAYDDAGAADVHPDRLGVVIGTGAGNVPTSFRMTGAIRDGDPKAISPYWAVAGSVAACASLPALALGARGPTFSTCGACATAAYSMVSAVHLLEAGDADVVLAGGVDVLRTPIPIASFENLRALARHPEPARASRPLDLHRNGFVLTEGAAVLTLEPLERARRREARIYGLLVGYGLAGDAGDALAASAEGIARACRLALEKAGASPDEIDHVNLHAAGTRQGDAAEASAIHEVLGERASSIPVTAPKSLFGHAMGAAPGLETVLLLKTLETGVIPPTINLETPDPGIRLSASGQRVDADVRTALKTTLGVGGLNAALVFRAAIP